MKVEAEIKRWGNSLAIRITGTMASIPKLREGSKVSVDISEKGLLIKPQSRKSRNIKFPYSEKKLLAGMTPKKAHADELALLISKEVAV